MIKLIASDMDGTLLNDKIAVSTENAAAIKAAQAAGIDFIVATGRNLLQAKPALVAHDLAPAYITINGALVYDEAEAVKVTVPIAPAKLAALFSLLDGTGLYYELAGTAGVISNSHAGRLANIVAMFNDQDPTLTPAAATAKAEAHIKQVGTQYVARYQDLLATATPVYKVIAFADAKQAALAPVKTAVTALGGLVVTSSGARNIEINHTAAQKGPALATYAAQQGYTMAEVMAIGDNLNDESMIRMAKYSVAMGNAIPLIKKLAWYTTASNHHDGVAQAIYRAIALNDAEAQEARHAVLH